MYNEQVNIIMFGLSFRTHFSLIAHFLGNIGDRWYTIFQQCYSLVMVDISMDIDYHIHTVVLYIKKGDLNLWQKMFTCKETNQGEGQMLIGRNCRKKHTSSTWWLIKWLDKTNSHKNRESDISCFEGIASRIPHMTPILYNDNTNISFMRQS